MSAPRLRWNSTGVTGFLSSLKAVSQSFAQVYIITVPIANLSDPTVNFMDRIVRLVERFADTCIKVDSAPSLLEVSYIQWPVMKFIDSKGAQLTNCRYCI